MKSLPFYLILLLFLVGCQFLPTKKPLAVVITEPPSDSAYESLTAVTSTTIPARDMAQLARDFQGVDAPRVISTEPTPISDSDSFWIKNLSDDSTVQINANRVYLSDALVMWVEEGAEVDSAALQAAATRIEQEILPTNRAFFGTEWQPGVDGDNRIHILHIENAGGMVAAYFWSGDEYVTAVNPYSNQREMLTISLSALEPDSEEYLAAVAHELEHLIQWHTDANETAWLDEGMGELAAHINGLPVNRADDYVLQPDVQLTDLRQEPGIVNAHYAASYLFTVYFLDRFGEEATRALVSHPANGRSGFDAVLAELDSGLTFDDLFADWLVANYLAGIEREQGVYQYETVVIPELKPHTLRQFPATGVERVNQYGADFIRLQSERPLTIVFTGTQQIPLVDTVAYSGDKFWFSSPADEGYQHLTRAFDLRDVDEATLTFWTWYDIEEGWDYGYVAVSTDDGASWNLLETDSTTRDNPQGNNIGPGYTGKSGGGDDAEWVQETAVLTPYTGQEILLRFVYLTDGAVHEAGFLIDDLAIPEIGYMDDVEQGDNGWESAGFARTSAVLPQQFIVQSVLVTNDGVQIKRLPLNEQQQGVWQLPLDETTKEAILIVSGSTPVTTAPAAYEYRVMRAE